jgi:hypothetical protein
MIAQFDGIVIFYTIRGGDAIVQRASERTVQRDRGDKKWNFPETRLFFPP